MSRKKKGRPPSPECEKKVPSAGVPNSSDDEGSVLKYLEEDPSPYADDFRKLQTGQQKRRDEAITTLFYTYIDAYKKKVTSRDTYQKELFEACLSIVRIFAVFFILLTFLPVFFGSTESVSGALSIATASISFLVLIIELLKIITHYCFPENDEQYITEIVKAIQNNDLEDKRLNLTYKKGSMEDTNHSTGEADTGMAPFEPEGDP